MGLGDGEGGEEEGWGGGGKEEGWGGWDVGGEFGARGSGRGWDVSVGRAKGSTYEDMYE